MTIRRMKPPKTTPRPVDRIETRDPSKDAAERKYRVEKYARQIEHALKKSPSGDGVEIRYIDNGHEYT